MSKNGVNRTDNHLIALGASTGGTEALRVGLAKLPKRVNKPLPDIVITQHIAPSFAQQLADSLNKTSLLAVKVASDGEWIEAGQVYMAPGDRHLLVESEGGRYRCKLDDGPAQDKHKPSVDRMFDSLVSSAGGHTIASLLTGMGKDGARGMLALHRSGAYTIAQDEQSSVVWGMPGEAVKIKAVTAVVSIEQMAQQIAAGLMAH